MAIPTMAPVDSPPPPPPPPLRPGTVMPSASEVMPTLLVWMPACAQNGAVVKMLVYTHANATVVAWKLACTQRGWPLKGLWTSKLMHIYSGRLHATEGNAVRVGWRMGSPGS